MRSAVPALRSPADLNNALKHGSELNKDSAPHPSITIPLQSVKFTPFPISISIKSVTHQHKTWNPFHVKKKRSAARMNGWKGKMTLNMSVLCEKYVCGLNGRMEAVNTSRPHPAVYRPHFVCKKTSFTEGRAGQRSTSAPPPAASASVWWAGQAWVVAGGVMVFYLNKCHLPACSQFPIRRPPPAPPSDKWLSLPPPWCHMILKTVNSLQKLHRISFRMSHKISLVLTICKPRAQNSTSIYIHNSPPQPTTLND